MPLLDPFMDDQPFDILSHAGAAVFATASAPLEVTWDGTFGQFPSFVIALWVRASEACSTAATPPGC